MARVSEINLLFGLLNKFVFQEAKLNIADLKGYYKNDINLQQNTLIGRLIDFIESSQFENITDAALSSLLVNDGKIDDEITSILQMIKEFQSYSQEQAIVFSDTLKKFCYTYRLTKVKKQTGNDIVKFTEEVKKIEYKSVYSDVLQVEAFSKLDIDELIEMYSAEGYKSRYDFINNSSVGGGYLPGQIVVVCACPGVGKSLFMQGEAVNFIEQGKRVHIICLGDLNRLDLIKRMTCMIAKKPKREVESNLKQYYGEYKHLFEELLYITTVPSGVVTAEEYSNWMLNMIDEFDILIVDYDSGFLGQDESSMYDKYGNIFETFTRLTDKGKLLFVASQPSKSYHGKDIMPQEAVSESLRKIQIADVIITIGKSPNAVMPIGKIHLAKSRRGDPDVELIQPYIRTNEGLFFPCSKELYLKFDDPQYSEGKFFSWKELEGNEIVEVAHQKAKENKEIKKETASKSKEVEIKEEIESRVEEVEIRKESASKTEEDEFPF